MKEWREKVRRENVRRHRTNSLDLDQDGDDGSIYKAGSGAFQVDEVWWNHRFKSLEENRKICGKRFKNWDRQKLNYYGEGDRYLEGQHKERVIDHNSKGEVRLRFRDDSPWNDLKEKKLLREVLLMQKEMKRQDKTNRMEELTKSFIRGNNKWVDEKVWQEVLQGRDGAITEALQQIHMHSLRSNPLAKEKESYKDILMSVHKQDMKAERRQDEKDFKRKETEKEAGYPDRRPKRNKEFENHMVFVYNIPENAQLKELWTIFKKAGSIKDLILPQKRDKYNRRSGFIKTGDNSTVRNLIRVFNGTVIRHSTIGVFYARKKIKTEKEFHFGADWKGGKSWVDEKLEISKHKSIKKESGNLGNGSVISSMGGETKEESVPEHVIMDSKTSEIDRGKNSISHNQSLIENLETNKDFEEVLGRSLLVETWKEDNFLAIRNTMDLLGYGEVEVKTISSKSFMVTFPVGTNLEELDLDFIGLGFLNIRKADIENTVLPRKAWVEIQGLPFAAWIEVNFEKMVCHLVK